MRLIRHARLLPILILATLPWPAQGQQPARDVYGDSLPPAVRLRFGTLRLRHASRPHTIAFTPDSKQLVTADQEAIYVWDMATGKKLHQFPEAGHFAVSPNGKLLAATSSDGLRLWELATGKARTLVSSEKGSVLAFTPDGATLAVSGDEGITLWEVRTGEMRQRLTTDVSCNCLAFCPGRQLLAVVGADGAVHLWDGVLLKKKKVLPRSHYALDFVTFSADGKTFAASGTYDTCVWETATCKKLRHLKGYRGTVGSVGLSADGTMLAVSGSNAPFQLIDVATGKEIRRIAASEEGICGAALSPDGKVLAAGAWGDSLVHLWSADDGKRLHAFAGHPCGVSAVAFSADGRTLVSGSVDGLRQWDCATGRQRQHLATEYVVALALSRDGKTLATGHSGQSVRLWNPATLQELRQVEPASDNNSVAFSPDSSLLAVGGINDPTVRLWNPITGKEVRRLELQPPDSLTNQNTNVAIAPDGKTLVSTTSTRTRLWDVATAKELWQVDYPSLPQCLRFSPGGNLLATAQRNGMVVLRQATTGKMIREIPLAEDQKKIWQGAYRLAFSPNGKTLAVAYDEWVRLLDVANGQELRRFPGRAYSLAFSPDGERLAVGRCDTTILIWDVSGR